MAAIVDENQSIDLDDMYKNMVKMLPAYARPLFVRLLQKADTTGKPFLFLRIVAKRCDLGRLHSLGKVSSCR